MESKRGQRNRHGTPEEAISMSEDHSFGLEVYTEVRSAVADQY